MISITEDQLKILSFFSSGVRRYYEAPEAA
jgi:hypothetical protein